MRDIHTGMFISTLIVNATYSADTTPVSVDLQTYDAAEIVIACGAGGITFTTTNKIEFVLTHSDDNSTFVNVTDADVLGVTGLTTTGIIKSLVAALASGGVFRFGYKGGRRYLRLLADFSGTHGTGTPIGAYAILAEPFIAPTANQA
jgi:hypothetical protein